VLGDKRTASATGLDNLLVRERAHTTGGSCGSRIPGTKDLRRVLISTEEEDRWNRRLSFLCKKSSEELEFETLQNLENPGLPIENPAGHTK
jgi:hypothetical protein